MLPCNRGPLVDEFRVERDFCVFLQDYKWPSERIILPIRNNCSCRSYGLGIIEGNQNLPPTIYRALGHPRTLRIESAGEMVTEPPLPRNSTTY